MREYMRQIAVGFPSFLKLRKTHNSQPCSPGILPAVTGIQKLQKRINNHADSLAGMEPTHSLSLVTSIGKMTVCEIWVCSRKNQRRPDEQGPMAGTVCSSESLLFCTLGSESPKRPNSWENMTPTQPLASSNQRWPWALPIVLVTKSCPTLLQLYGLYAYSFATLWTVWTGSSVHGILQARILEWVAIPFSRGSSPPRDRTWVSCIGR